MTYHTTQTTTLPPSHPSYEKEQPSARYCGRCVRRHALRVVVTGVGLVRRCGYCLAQLRAIVQAAKAVTDSRADDPRADDTVERP